MFLRGKVNHNVLTSLLSNVVFAIIYHQILKSFLPKAMLTSNLKWQRSDLNSKKITSVNKSDPDTRNLKFGRQMYFASVGIWIH